MSWIVSEAIRDKSLAELLKDMSQELTALLTKRPNWAKLRNLQRGSVSGRGRFARGRRCLGPARVGLLAASVMAALSLAVPIWLAALLVALTLQAVAVVRGLRGHKGRCATRIAADP